MAQKSGHRVENLPYHSVLAATKFGITASDWSAIQQGTLDRMQAFMQGKIKVTGDVTLFMQLEDAIGRLSHGAA